MYIGFVTKILLFSYSIFVWWLQLFQVRYFIQEIIQEIQNWFSLKFKE